jgi:hypothetical protein
MVSIGEMNMTVAPETGSFYGLVIAPWTVTILSAAWQITDTDAQIRRMKSKKRIGERWKRRFMVGLAVKPWESQLYVPLMERKAEEAINSIMYRHLLSIDRISIQYSVIVITI